MVESKQGIIPYFNHFPGSIVKMKEFSYAKIIGLSASLICIEDKIVAAGVIDSSSIEVDKYEIRSRSNSIYS